MGVQEEFMAACESGDLESVKRLLLEYPEIDINQANYLEDGTPLHRACANGHVEIVELLLQNERIDVNKADNKGKTPFYATCKNDNLEVVELLLTDKRLNVDRADIYGRTPLFVAKTAEIRTMIIADTIAKASKEQIKAFDPAQSFNENLLQFSKDAGLIFGDIDSSLFDGITPDDIIRELKKIAEERVSGTFALMILHCDEFLSLKEDDNQANSTSEQSSPSSSPATIGQAINAMKQFSQTR